MKLSFKFKIALLSFTVSGALLTAFGTLFFAFAFHNGIDRMDREIRTLAESSLHGARPAIYWNNYDRSLSFIYGESNPTRLALLVVNSQDQVVFQSKNAPPELATLPRPHRSSPADNGRPLNAESLSNRLDQNSDGRISPTEFDGPPTDFFMFDTDKDGFISRDEAAQNDTRPMAPPPMHGEPIHPDPPTFQTLETAKGNWRIGTFNNPKLSVLMAMDMGVFYADINRFRIAFIITVPMGLILLGISGWFMAARAMKPVAIIADTAAGITAKGLNLRIPDVGSDIELERLVCVVNHMLDRLEKSYQQAMRFSADAAHELQTPLTILQGELDNAIQTSSDGSTEQQRYSMLLEELRNLKAIVQKLLLLAHADEGRLKLNLEPVDLSELVRNATEDLEMMAPTLTLRAHIEEGIWVQADHALLNQAIRNMTSNAAKYTTENGEAIFTLERDHHSVHFTLANTAPAISDQDRSLLFDRFYRVEKSRTAAGSGLGLSLALEIIRAHGGNLVLDPAERGRVSFTLSLPVNPT